jgi:hypothetical protein
MGLSPDSRHRTLRIVLYLSVSVSTPSGPAAGPGPVTASLRGKCIALRIVLDLPVCLWAWTGENPGAQQENCCFPTNILGYRLRNPCHVIFFYHTSLQGRPGVV